MRQDDTIVAVSTPMYVSALGVVRVSGPEALGIVEKFFTAPLQGVPSRTAVHGYIKDGEALIDEVLVTVFRAPGSYTGEDVAEISCHGSLFVLNAVVRLAIRNGARQASAGEFTKRAYMNGKMDLAEAESVIDLIESETLLQARTALTCVRGALSERIDSVRESLVGLSANILAFIDFPDDGVEDVSAQAVSDVVNGALEEVGRLAGSFSRGRIIRSGVRTVICGRPNAGKSTLMNSLLGCERCIVTENEGTTRDIVEEPAVIGGIKFVLSDTAGIRTASDAAEKMGVKMAEKKMAEADMLLCVFDASAPLSGAELEFADRARTMAGYRIAVLNKSDSPVVLSAADLPGFDAYAQVSAEYGEGMDELREIMSSFAGSADLSGNTEVITNLRHYECLVRCREALVRAAENINLTPDALLLDIEEAIDALGSITGRSAGEDIIENIFSRFCVGK